MDKVIQVNIDDVIRGKSEKLHRLLPRFAVNYLKRIVHQDEVNDILRRYHGKSGIDFANGLTAEFNVQFEVHNEDKIPKQNNLIIASNHPLGGFDGLALISLISRYHSRIKFPVNDLLMHVPNLRDIFVPINTIGSKSIQMARQFDEVFASDNVILYFPAGLCSRKINGKIQDLPWKKTFVSKAKEFHRDILPIYFDGKNSSFFYNLANIRKALKIKANIEMLYLCNELFKQKNSTYKIYIGDLIPHNQLDTQKTDYQLAQDIREKVISLHSDNF
ncbi:MAG: 1-acyl-sn-glycerol-3-phosphate acyltransferase [Lentimicrobiaceae bacterium]|nr:1-acyl-sn-glycerol-3-phosphate acyltransferase [Lentimicrobiaceae bacterium]